MAPIWQLNDEESDPSPLPQPHQRERTANQWVFRAHDPDQLNFSMFLRSLSTWPRALDVPARGIRLATTPSRAAARSSALRF
jgi:hypothetical protein